jgi:hypothetical protein
MTRPASLVTPQMIANELFLFFDPTLFEPGKPGKPASLQLCGRHRSGASYSVVVLQRRKNPDHRIHAVN